MMPVQGRNPISRRCSSAQIACLGAALVLLIPSIVVLKRIVVHITDRGTWIRDRVLARRYPRGPLELAQLTDQGVALIVNLHQRAHDPAMLSHYGITEIHLPTADYTAPSFEMLGRGVDALIQARARGTSTKVCVHCAGGRGRTGTLLACYLIATEGLSSRDAIAEMRRVRPGSVETKSQAAAVEHFERRLHH